VNLAIRWFAGYRLDEALPERSSLTRIRQRWGAILGRNSTDNGHFFRARSCDCRVCSLRERCIAPTAHVRQILIVDGFTALLRARRRKEKRWDEQTREKYIRHRWRVEGVHGRAKTQHGLSRAVGRGIKNVTIQAYLTAAVMNLKKLAAAQTALDSMLGLAKGLLTKYLGINRDSHLLFDKESGS